MDIDELSKKKNLYFTIVDLEKDSNQVPRDVVLWALKIVSIAAWLVKIVQSIFKNTQISIKVNWIFIDDFLV